MQRTLIKDTITKVGETVVIKGWVTTRRDHGKIVFLDISDRSALIQVVATADQLPELGIGYAVEIEGLIKKRPEKLINPKLATGMVELEVKKTNVLTKAQTYPFDMGKPELDLELST